MNPRLQRLADDLVATRVGTIALDRFDAARFNLSGDARREAGALPAPEQRPALLAFARQHFPGGPNQNDEELLAFLDHVADQNPQVILEIGTEAGGTHFLLGAALPTVELAIAVDLIVRNRHRLDAFARPGLALRHIQGSSRDEQAQQRVRELLAGRPVDLLFIDGDHSFFGATEDFKLYAPLVREGGMIAFHDIVSDQRFRTGVPSGANAGEVPLVWNLIKQRLPHKEFVVDPEQDGKGIGVTRKPAGPLEWPFRLPAA